VVGCGLPCERPPAERTLTGLATGLAAGAPQLGAGAAVGTAFAAGGVVLPAPPSDSGGRPIWSLRRPAPCSLIE
jgi:hypothetical protein